MYEENGYGVHLDLLNGNGMLNILEEEGVEIRVFTSDLLTLCKLING